MSNFQIHPLSLLTFLFAFISGYIYEVLLLFTVVIIHELGHAFSAKAFGWRVVKISLLPIGGVAVVEEHGNKPFGEEVLVIIAGPLMNVVMIGCAYLCYALGVWSPSFTHLFIDYNVMILLFNLLPIYPLDGGKLWQALLSLLFPYKRAISFSLISSALGLVLYLYVIAACFSSYILLWMIGIFLIFSLVIYLRQSPYQFMRFLLDRQLRGSLQTGCLQIRSIVMEKHQTVKDALENMFRQRYHYFCLIDNRGELLHVFSEKELLHAYFYQQQGFRTLEDMIK